MRTMLFTAVAALALSLPVAGNAVELAVAAPKASKGANYRSAKSGRYVTKGYAGKNKSTTVREAKPAK